MRCFVTKYALTRGILQVEVELCLDVDPDGGMVADHSEYHTCYHKPDWHRTRVSAVARAEQMRLAKLASLRKQITKLEAMSFEEKADG